MVNIFAFEKALKLTWIQRCLKNSDSQWYNMFQLICNITEKLFKLDNEWCLLFSETLTNNFGKIFCKTGIASVKNNYQKQILKYLKVQFGTIQIYLDDKLTFPIGMIKGYI